MTPAPDRDTEDAALRTIILYKLVKAAVQLLLAAVFFGAVLVHRTDLFEDAAVSLLHHASQAWAVRAAAMLMRLATRRYVELAAVALLFDGTLSGVESWALHTRRWWAEWLVVVASGSLLPYELYELGRHPRAGRLLVLVVNVVIVVYLARRARRRGRSSDAGG